ncbi:acetyltransferase [Purpureocillium lavendulum]|uniref:Acetyltransferase n=1 Tax=Purpureocillium lavendulum TaxID=1247861 RepID=A0AB34G101_9HYPO|nr:acetyltransferase [Purpureocillium lavendulum]
MTTNDGAASHDDGPGPEQRAGAPAHGLKVELVVDADDLADAFDCTCEAFGRQTKDGIWRHLTPGWDTPEGRERAVSLLVKRWRSTTTDDQGRRNAIFLKATLPIDSEGQQPASTRALAGFAIWLQASAVPGYGDAPAADLRQAMDLEAMYPGDEAAQRYACQIDASLHRQRIQVVKDKAEGGAAPPAVMVLDICCVHPKFQGRGVGKALAKWGVDEARARGIEAVTEASVMGRRVYEKLGFRQEGPEIVYDVDAEFADRELPSNIFMRTGVLGET